MTACELCGTPTASKYGICGKTPECQREYNAAYQAANREEILRRRAAWREANREKKRTADAAYRAANREAKKKRNAAYREANRDRILKQRAARRRAAGIPVRGQGKSPGARRERERERNRRRRRRDDVPCAYAKFGCANLKVRNSRYCRSHRKAAERRRLKHQRQAMKQRRAQAQGWTCTWCGHPLPADLKDTHQDHVIPSAVAIAVTGRIINDEWNMDVLHDVCNRAKRDSLTPRAIALAAAHGISLRAA